MGFQLDSVKCERRQSLSWLPESCGGRLSAWNDSLETPGPIHAAQPTISGPP